MHILEQYAVNCGAKIDKPYIFKEYISIPFEKYIVLHAGSGMDSKNYDYYDDVVSFLIKRIDSLSIYSPAEIGIFICISKIFNIKI